MTRSENVISICDLVHMAQTCAHGQLVHMARNNFGMGNCDGVDCGPRRFEGDVSKVAPPAQPARALTKERKNYGNRLIFEALRYSCEDVYDDDRVTRVTAPSRSRHALQTFTHLKVKTSNYQGLCFNVNTEILG
eukprot:2641092-Prymnesium_polylepis.1